ncbi:MAG: trk/ktr system potassium uptake protein [Clostridia bacterium]|nr:trk/ktr system potassium uptake protein [Clostridia bacterium]
MRHLTPPRILVLGFIVLITIGSVLLSLPFATESGIPLSPIDALFTATSATAVTGLIVVDTAQTFSTFGELVILTLIQIGGLGFMTISTLLALAIGKKISFRERLVMKEEINGLTLGGIVKLTKVILLLTFSLEGISTFILGLYWSKQYGLAKGFYLGLFHSISAFCNAGFDLFSKSLVDYKGDILVNLVIIILFVLGGLGFTVIADILTHEKWSKFSLHSKLVLAITGFLLLFGFAAVFIFEFNNSLVGMPLKDKILASIFQGATPRTAGFNTLPIDELRFSTIFLIMFLMFIGASSGSTGGGVKITTVGTIMLAVFSTVRDQEETVVFGRKIPEDIILKSVAIVVISLGWIVLVSLILLVTENAPFEVIIFEVFSAFGTVGLSMGLTSQLTLVGKIVILITMLIGRVGPLTLAFAIFERSSANNLHYPEEKIMVG